MPADVSYALAPIRAGVHSFKENSKNKLLILMRHEMRCTVQDGCIRKEFVRISKEQGHTPVLLVIDYKMKSTTKRRRYAFMSNEDYHVMVMFRSIER